MPAKTTQSRRSIFRFFRGILPAAAWSALLPGCATVGPNPPPRPSFALAQPETTRLGSAFAPARNRHPGQSGFALLDYGLEALVARAATADAADRTIDAQYYIYDHDEAGSLLTARLIRAADRGVRVRLLLDDFNFGSERELIALCAHPRIEVRVFNPISHSLRWARLLEYAIHFQRADRRMHNKLFLVDNEIAILGGRNIGDDYFNVHAAKAFRDFDVLAAGPAAAQASAAFDRFWNSPWSVPAPALIGRRPTPADLDWLRGRIVLRLKKAAKFETNYGATRDRYLSSLEHDENALLWAPGEIVSDPPDKVEATTRETTPVTERFQEEWARAKKEILIGQAYFVPESPGARSFRELRDSHVAVRILTSGADTTDVPIVYSAYRKSRRSLLEAGVELHEYRPQPATNPPGLEWYQVRPPYAALHSKVMVFDRQLAWIGSFNLDPRSERLNTEIVVLIRSERLAGQLAQAIVDDFSPERSWQVRLAAEPGGTRKAVVWTGLVGGRPVTLRHEPVGIGRSIEVFFLSLIPGIRAQL